MIMNKVETKPFFGFLGSNMKFISYTLKYSCQSALDALFIIHFTDKPENESAN